MSEAGEALYNTLACYGCCPDDMDLLLAKLWTLGYKVVPHDEHGYALVPHASS